MALAHRLSPASHPFSNIRRIWAIHVRPELFGGKLIGIQVVRAFGERRAAECPIGLTLADARSDEHIHRSGDSKGLGPCDKGHLVKDREAHSKPYVARHLSQLSERPIAS